MENNSGPNRAGWVSTLRPFKSKRPDVERCELCGVELGPVHQHLINPESRQLACSCDACAILFSGGARQRYQRVPRRIDFLPDFRLTDAQWDNLMIPINMAFVYHSSVAGRAVALYPGPAGATESLLTLEAWESLAEENPILRKLEPDVEALLINRVKSPAEYYRAPIDECYRLVGLFRTHWRGLGGGALVWGVIGEFFDELKGRSHA